MKQYVKQISVLVLASIFTLGASTAWAVPMTVSVQQHLGFIGSASGEWSLTGATHAGEEWSVSALGTDYQHTTNLNAGEHVFGISGSMNPGFIGGITWSVSVGGQNISSDSHWSGLFKIVTFESGEVQINTRSTSVPEPGTLALLGAGLLAMAMVVGTRRRKGMSA